MEQIYSASSYRTPNDCYRPIGAGLIRAYPDLLRLSMRETPLQKTVDMKYIPASI